ncbi:MAG: sugar transferase, partial [Mesorhizobium sp.]
MRDVAKPADADFPHAGIDFPPIGGLLKRSF